MPIGGLENNGTRVLMIPWNFVTLAKSLSEYVLEHAVKKAPREGGVEKPRE